MAKGVVAKTAAVRIEAEAAEIVAVGNIAEVRPAARVVVRPSGAAKVLQKSNSRS